MRSNGSRREHPWNRMLPWAAVAAAPRPAAVAGSKLAVSRETSAGAWKNEKSEGASIAASG